MGIILQALSLMPIRRSPFINLTMYLVAIAWMYVVVMMAVAEASAANGSLLGAVITLVLYGLLPLSLLLYILGTPARKRALRARAQADAASSHQPDAGGHAPAAPQQGAIAPVRKEP